MCQGSPNLSLKIYLAGKIRDVCSRMQLEDIRKDDPVEEKSMTDSGSEVFSDEFLLKIIEKLCDDPYPCSLVCKRWLRLQGRLRCRIRLKDWRFLHSGRMTARFPNLTDVDLTEACVPRPEDSSVLLTNSFLRIWVSAVAFDPFPIEKSVAEQQLFVSLFDEGLRVLAEGCQGLQRLRLLDVRRVCDHVGKRALKEMKMHDVTEKSENGLTCVSKSCQMLQELEVLYCSDNSVDDIAAFPNLQILGLVGSVDESGSHSFTDIGLTKLAHKCKRLFKLELTGCECSYEGIAAIGQCCLMLEELTLSNNNFEEGWIAGLTYCSNLKILRLDNCKTIDANPGPGEHLGLCSALERLQLRRCNLHDKRGFGALVLVCCNVKELELENCWGLTEEVFVQVLNCRALRCLSLEGCSLVTTSVLESVLVAMRDLEKLHVVSCNNIRDSEITPMLASLFPTLKELRWCPDTKSLLSVAIAGTGLAHSKGGKLLRKA